MSTRNRLDLQSLGSQPVIMPRNLPIHWTYLHVHMYNAIVVCTDIGILRASQPNLQVMSSVRGDFWAYPFDILVIPSPTGYMLASFGFPLIKWDKFYKFLLNYR